MRKTALITGAAGGIGKSICDLFHNEGYEVIGIDCHPVDKRPYKVVHLDITDFAETNPASQDLYKTVESLSDARLDVLVNNAAIQIVKTVPEITDEDWKVTLDTNLLAPFRLVQLFLPMLKKAKGSVINVSSIHAAATKSGFSLYATSKGALDTLTRALAIELAPDVRVNSVNPAATDTPMLRDGFKDNPQGLKQLGDYHPLRRIAKPVEVAQIAFFLASEKASFITGSSINVDGGIGACLHDPVSL